MIIIGLDASTKNTGWSVFQNNALIGYGVIREKGNLDWRERVIKIHEELSGLIDQYHPNIIYLEDVPLKKGSLTIQKLSVVQGMIMGLCATHNIEIKFLLPVTWRKSLGLFDGTKNGLKREVLKQKAVEMANDKFHLNLQWIKKDSVKNEDDIAEAILIAYSQIQK